jgi:hypothetical protein
MLEAAEVADLSAQPTGREGVDAAEAAEPGNRLRPGAGRDQLGQCTLECGPPLQQRLNRGQIVDEGDA